MENIKFYIAHYPFLIQRKEYIIKSLTKNNIMDFVFIEHLNNEEIKDDDYNFNNSSEEIKKRLSGKISESIINQFISDGMNKNEKSLSLKHKFAYEHFLKYSNKKYFVVLEDDVIFCKNFLLNFLLLEKCLPNDFDLLLFGSGTTIKTEHDKNIFFNSDYHKNYNFYDPGNHSFGRGCDSYLGTRKASEKLNAYFQENKIVSPIDWELSRCSDFLKTISCSPTLTYQGSASGEYVSSIRDRKGMYG